MLSDGCEALFKKTRLMRCEWPQPSTGLPRLHQQTMPTKKVVELKSKFSIEIKSGDVVLFQMDGYAKIHNKFNAATTNIFLCVIKIILLWAFH